MNGTELLADFRETGSETAFAGLVRQYTNLVFAAARRRLNSIPLAEDATQAVFVRLARNAPRIHSDAELAAWLHRTTVHVSIDLWRTETRRFAREQRAASMPLPDSSPPTWDRLAPVLDEALNELEARDREVLLLRFFAEKPMRDVGANLGVSEDAAKMRVSRAVERLRQILSGRGVNCTSLSLAALMAEHAIEVAPAALVERLGAFRFMGPASAGGIAGALAWIRQATVLRWALPAGVGLGITFAVVATRMAAGTTRPAGTVAAPRSVANAAPGAPMPPTAGAGPAGLSTPPAPIPPDPRKLIAGILDGRQRLTSGTGEWERTSVAQPGDSPGLVTNVVRLEVRFDAARIYCEYAEFEYAYTAMGGEGSEGQQRRILQEKLDRAAAVEAGLLRRFESRHRALYDGEKLIDYWENDGRAQSATIHAPVPLNHSTRLFDPRGVGLAAHPGFRTPVQEYYGLRDAESMELVGRENLGGTDAWHVRARIPDKVDVDFWVEVRNPERALKLAVLEDRIESRYDEADPSDPLPVWTRVTTTAAARASWSTELRRLKMQYHQPVPPEVFTLAGLRVPVGTEIVDTRIMRRIGYWDGAALTDDMPNPRKAATKAPPAPSPTSDEREALLQDRPASPEGLEAATSVVLNTPDGSEVARALTNIQQYHVRSPAMLELCQQLDRLRHRGAPALLEAILRDNPSAEIRAASASTLGNLRRDAAEDRPDPKAIAEAEKFYERAIAEASKAGRPGVHWARQAAEELATLRTTTIGKPAPPAEGEDLDGQPLSLDEHRGQVVMLVFWSHYLSEAAEWRKALEPFKDRPVTWLGVNCDSDQKRAKAEVAKQEVTWRSFADGQDGPISRAWHNRSWPRVYLLDKAGVIRYRNPRGRELVEAIEALLRD